MSIPRSALQTVITKLDLGYITLKEAKDWVWHTYGVEVPGRTKAAWIKALSSKGSN